VNEWTRKMHKFRTAEDYRDHLPCVECESIVELRGVEDFDALNAVLKLSEAEIAAYKLGGLEAVLEMRGVSAYTASRASSLLNKASKEVQRRAARELHETWDTNHFEWQLSHQKLK